MFDIEALAGVFEPDQDRVVEVGKLLGKVGALLLHDRHEQESGRDQQRHQRQKGQEGADDARNPQPLKGADQRVEKKYQSGREHQRKPDDADAVCDPNEDPDEGQGAERHPDDERDPLEPIAGRLTHHCGDCT